MLGRLILGLVRAVSAWLGWLDRRRARRRRRAWLASARRTAGQLSATVNAAKDAGQQMQAFSVALAKLAVSVRGRPMQQIGNTAAVQQLAGHLGPCPGCGWADKWVCRDISIYQSDPVSARGVRLKGNFVCPCGTGRIVECDVDGLEALGSGRPPSLPTFHLDRPVRAFRQWRLTCDDEGPLLASVGMRDGRWPGPIMHAAAGPPEPDGPYVGRDPPPGIYAMRHLCPHWVEDDAGITVCGDVEMWGRVVEHELGYRAEHARVVRLWVHPGAWTTEDEHEGGFTAQMVSSMASAIAAMQMQARGVTQASAEVEVTIPDPPPNEPAPGRWYRSDAAPPWRFPDGALYEALRERYQVDEVGPMPRAGEQAWDQPGPLDPVWDKWLEARGGERDSIRDIAVVDEEYLEDYLNERRARHGHRTGAPDTGGGAGRAEHGTGDAGGGGYIRVPISFTFSPLAGLTGP